MAQKVKLNIYNTLAKDGPDGQKVPLRGDLRAVYTMSAPTGTAVTLTAASAPITLGSAGFYEFQYMGAGATEVGYNFCAITGTGTAAAASNPVTDVDTVESFNGTDRRVSGSFAGAMTVTMLLAS